MSDVFEYRVTVQGRHTYREVANGGTAIFRSDDPLWQNWKPDAEDESWLTGLHGVEGIAIATAREQSRDGKLGVRVEKRAVGPWSVVE